MKNLRIGVVMDPLESINPAKDSTLALMLEAQKRGYELYYITLDGLRLLNNIPMAEMQKIEVFNKSEKWYETKQTILKGLNWLDVILMRKDPPFDMEYIISTYILEAAQDQGVLVINNPKSLRDVNEKVYIYKFFEYCVPSLLSRNMDTILDFINKHQKIVLKPLNKMGGKSVFVINKGDGNTKVIIEELTQHNSRFVQAQVYIPEIKDSGDKRILILNGEPLFHGITRIPSSGDHRGNMAVGASYNGITLSKREIQMCENIGFTLRQMGIYFAGIDIIGDYLTEINITSPTGIREIEKTSGVNAAEIFFNNLQYIYI